MVAPNHQSEGTATDRSSAANQVELLRSGVEKWNEWRRTNPEVIPELCSVDLSGLRLRGVNFSRTNLTGAILVETDLRSADLSSCDLSGAVGLTCKQLSGANLSGSRISPDYFAAQWTTVTELTRSAQRLFIAMLVACMYAALTIATTTDLGLISNSVSSPLPIIGTPIPIVSFYYVGPLILLCAFLYFHLYLQRLWEALADLPAIFPDGQSLTRKISPWLLNGIVRRYLAHLRSEHLTLYKSQLVLSIILAWLIVPITVGLFNWRFFPRHDLFGSRYLFGLLIVTLTAAVYSQRLTASAFVLYPETAKRSKWSVLGKLRQLPVVGGIVVLILAGYGFTKMSDFFGYYPAQVGSANLSHKPPGWDDVDQPSARMLRLVQGAQLEGYNLRQVWAPGAFLVHANLENANLIWAEIERADLRGADLTHASINSAALEFADMRDARMFGAILDGAFVREANLRGANLEFAQLHGANLWHADLAGADVAFADFRTASDISVEQIRSCVNFDKAFYDPELIGKLGFNKDHNEAIVKHMDDSDVTGWWMAAYDSKTWRKVANEWQLLSAKHWHNDFVLVNPYTHR